MNELHRHWLGKSSQTGAQWRLRTFKVMARSGNVFADVNAGFLALVDSSKGFQIMSTPRIVIGGIAPTFVHAQRTEEFLNGKMMNNHDVFKEALTILTEELKMEQSRLVAS